MKRRKRKRVPFEPERTSTIARIRRMRRRLAKARQLPRTLPRAVARKTRRAAVTARRRWQTANVVGGPIKRPAASKTTTKTTTRKTTTGRRVGTRPAGGTHTMSNIPTTTAGSRRLAIPEAERVRRAGLALGEMEAATTAEAYDQIASVGAALTAVAAGILAYAETLAVQKADPKRVVNPLIDEANRVSEAGTMVLRLARRFYQLYRGAIEQEEQSPVAPMTFKKAA